MLEVIGKWLAFVMAVFVMQSSFLPIIHYNGVGPDLLLLILASYAFFKGSRMGCFMGFLLGLFQDLATGTFFGVNTFTKMIIGYGCGIFSKRILRDSFILPISASIMSTAAAYLISGSIMLLLGYKFNILIHVTTHLVPMLCYNILLSYPMHAMVRKMIDDPDENKKRGIL